MKPLTYDEAYRYAVKAERRLVELCPTLPSPRSQPWKMLALCFGSGGLDDAADDVRSFVCRVVDLDSFEAAGLTVCLGGWSLNALRSANVVQGDVLRALSLVGQAFEVIAEDYAKERS